MKMNKQEVDLLMCPVAQLTIDLYIIILPALVNHCLIMQVYYFALQHDNINKMRTLTCQHGLSDELS